MSERFVCERCRRSVPAGGARYIARLEVFHDPTPPEITAQDLAVDHGAEIRKLLAQMASRDPRELEEEVYLRRERRLCAPCRKELLGEFERTRRRPRRRPR